MFVLFFCKNIARSNRFSHKDFGKAPDQNYPQAYNSTLRTNFYLGTQSKIFMTKSVTDFVGVVYILGRLKFIVRSPKSLNLGVKKNTNER